MSGISDSSFIESDLEIPVSFTDEDRALWHCELFPVITGRLTAKVSSGTLGGEFYEVEHTYEDVVFCECAAFQYCKPEKYVNNHEWCKHCERFSLVLTLRKLRRLKEPVSLDTVKPVETPQESDLDRKIAESTLTTNKPFSIL